MANADPVILHSLLGNHPNTKLLKSGAVSSPLVKFDYFEVKVANTQFKAMVRDLKYDFGELAMVTFLQAKQSASHHFLQRGSGRIEARRSWRKARWGARLYTDDRHLGARLSRAGLRRGRKQRHLGHV
jgi:hypothetical protein